MEAVRVLVLGASQIAYRGSGHEATLGEMTEQLLNKASDGRQFTVEALLLYPTRSMPERAGNAIERVRPDVLAFVAGANTFSEETVSFSIRKRAPWLYRIATRMVAVGRAVGGGVEGADSARGLLFRAPRALGKLVFGSAPMIDPSEAFAATSALFEYLEDKPDLRVVCALATGNYQQAEQGAVIRERTRSYNELLVRECDLRGYPWIDIRAAIAERGWPYVLAPDRLHEDEASRSHFAELLSDMVLAALGSHSPFGE
jgi:hypothetical protein